MSSLAVAGWRGARRASSRRLLVEVQRPAGLDVRQRLVEVACAHRCLASIDSRARPGPQPRAIVIAGRPACGGRADTRCTATTRQKSAAVETAAETRRAGVGARDWTRWRNRQPRAACRPPTKIRAGGGSRATSTRRRWRGAPGRCGSRCPASRPRERTTSAAPLSASAAAARRSRGQPPSCRADRLGRSARRGDEEPAARPGRVPACATEVASDPLWRRPACARRAPSPASKSMGLPARPATSAAAT